VVVVVVMDAFAASAIAAVCSAADAAARKSVEAPNWIKAKEPRDVRLVMELIAQVEGWNWKSVLLWGGGGGGVRGVARGCCRGRCKRVWRLDF
jgi:hypothetical protein